MSEKKFVCRRKFQTSGEKHFKEMLASLSFDDSKVGAVAGGGQFLAAEAGRILNEPLVLKNESLDCLSAN